MNTIDKTINTIIKKSQSIVHVTDLKISGTIDGMPFELEARLSSGLQIRMDITIDKKDYSYNCEFDIKEWFKTVELAHKKRSISRDTGRDEYFKKMHKLLG